MSNKILGYFGAIFILPAWALIALAQAEEFYWLLAISGGLVIILGIITIIRKKYSLRRSEISGLGAVIIGIIFIIIGISIEMVFLKTFRLFMN